MREGMSPDTWAVYVERSEDRLYYRKHNGIAPCYFKHVSQPYGEVKSIFV